MNACFSRVIAAPDFPTTIWLVSMILLVILLAGLALDALIQNAVRKAQNDRAVEARLLARMARAARSGADKQAAAFVDPRD